MEWDIGRKITSLSHLLVSVIWSFSVHNRYSATLWMGSALLFLRQILSWWISRILLPLPTPQHHIFHFLISHVDPYLSLEDVALCLSFVCVRFSHIICPSCLGSLLPVLPAPPPAPPPLPRAPSIPFSTSSSSGAPQACKMPISKHLNCSNG